MATSPSPNQPSSDRSADLTRPNRRRQRSVRVTVAVALLSVATGAVLLALPTQSPLWLSVAAVLSLTFGWAAARIVYTELVQSRAEAAADRAAQATAYKVLFHERADEHAAFTTAMTDRLATRDREVSDLQDTLVTTQQRAAAAEHRVLRETRRARDAEDRLETAEGRVAELEEQVSGLETELRRAAEREAEVAESIAGWEGFESLEGVGDLMAWQQLSEAVTAAQQAGSGGAGGATDQTA